jgi:glycosyltransferase involved in cell wall biosynthesis
MTPLLSVAIITLNEEQNLPRTLASVQWADEIVIVDSGSTDRTIDIARSFGARVIERPWPGFAEQKNFAIGECAGTWVLSLDADEELSPELQQEIQTLLLSKPEVDAFYLRRRNLFLGRWIKHGGFYPDAKLRLFSRAESTPQFEPRLVHETITCDGPTAELAHDLIHHAYPTLSSYIEHMDRYSDLGAKILIGKGRTSTSPLAFLMNIWVVPQLTFQWNYICRLGFLDGREGLLQHLYHAVYTSWKYAKAWEKSRS